MSPESDLTAPPTTVAQAVDQLAAARPNAPAVTDLSAIGQGRTVCFAELAERSRRTAAFLRGLGVRRGDAVATLLPNCTEWIDVFLAAARLGAVLVPLNTRYRSHELTHLLRLCGARVLVTADDFEGVDFSTRLDELAAASGTASVPVEHVVVVSGDVQALPASWTRHSAVSMLEAGPDADPVLHDAGAAPDPDDPLIVFGTSGTTSAPKLAVHTHRTVLTHTAAVATRLAFGETERQLAVLSLSGTFGFVPFLAGLLSGRPGALLPIFKIDRVLQALITHPSELLVCAEGSMRELLEVLDAPHVGRLRRLVTAGIAIEDIVDAAARLQVNAMNVYGSSEVFAFAGISEPGADREARSMPGGTVVAPGMDVRVADARTSVALPLGEVGELQFRGDTLFPYYLNNPAATDASRTADGWFRSGDSGRLVSRRTFQYLARTNDTLRLGGYSVSPADVESTIEQLATVKQAQVVGVRDPRSGDDLGVAFVLAQPDAEIDEQAVLEHCRCVLASFKIPKRVVIVDEYPTTPSANGPKVRRDQLRIDAVALLTGSFMAEV